MLREGELVSPGMSSNQLNTNSQVLKHILTSNLKWTPQVVLTYIYLFSVGVCLCNNDKEK